MVQLYEKSPIFAVYNFYMLIRIVKLSILPEKTSEFEEYFRQNRPRILEHSGCQEISLLRSSSQDVYITQSLWTDEESLERYRTSEFFRGIWPQAKTFFSAPAEAWSVEKVNG